jgi:hypothetical protein
LSCNQSQQIACIEHKRLEKKCEDKTQAPSLCVCVCVCDLNVQQSQTKLQEKRPQVAKKMSKLLLLYRVFQGFYFSRELGSEIQTNERNKICCQGLKFQTNEEAKKSPAKFSKEFSFCFPEFWVHRFSDTTKKKKRQSANS